MINLTANKGEWSELYALFKIFTDRTIDAADPNLQPNGETYTFLDIYREDDPGRLLDYDLRNDGEVRIIDANGTLVKIVNVREAPIALNEIFAQIKNGGAKAAFHIDQAYIEMSRFILTKIKASSYHKSDLDARIRDKVVSSSSRVGFSIKSQVGSPSTLLNASKQTNFQFAIKSFTCAEDDYLRDGHVLRQTLADIYNRAGYLQFTSVNSETFLSNMRTIDTVLPYILANMLVNYYRGRGKTMPELCRLCANENEFHLDYLEVSYKVKTFLRAIALGMVPGKRWNTYLAAHGGYIVVCEDGRLVCYHLYNDDEFRDFLFNNTKFETPSTSRHDFGKIYQQGGESYINLNLQIRFIK